ALQQNFTAEMKRLRDPAFQNLLVTYRRKPKTFTEAIENQDTVTSEYLFRDGAGKEYKPADYLEMFAKFVRENPNKSDAIGILLDRPKKWNTGALTELRAKLATAPGRFTIDNLESAHRVKYGKALVDIISMVKHAAREGEPLLTAGERVNRAFAKL